MKFLGKVLVGSDEESATELRVYEPSEAWLEWWNGPPPASGEDETVCCDFLGHRREEALADCGLWEEPEYSIAPGAVYHRYEVEVAHGLVLVLATTALNV